MGSKVKKDIKSKVKTEWNYDIFFKEEDAEKERKKVEEENYKFINKWKDRKDYLEEPEVLKEALDEYEQLSRYYGSGGKEAYYYTLKLQIDQNDAALKAKYGQIDEIMRKISNDIQFFGLNVSKIDEKKQSKFLNYPGLKKYKHLLENMFITAKHLLSDKEEKLMTLKSPSSYEKWVEMVQGLLSKEEREIIVENGKRERKTFDEIKNYMDSRNKKVRDDAARAFNDILAKYVDVAEIEINAILADKKVNDNLRKFDRPDSARHIGDDMDTKVVDTLIETVANRYDIAKRYYKFKAKLLGLKKLEYHERNVEYGSVDKKYTSDEAIEIIHNVFRNMDKEFDDIFNKFLINGEIDFFPKKGKRSGAFCIGSLISSPTYISLNYTNRLDDVRTIAHEVGHGINNELMAKKQHSLYYETPKSTAEVASTFMEAFVLDELIKEGDDEFKFSLILKELEDAINTITRQVAFYKFEQEMHAEFRKKGYLSKDELGKIFLKHMGAYMGGSVLQTPGSENWWIYVWHFREYFYVYSYASGLLISKALQGKYKKDNKFIGNIKEFLSAGTSDSPKNLFMKMGIDITKKEFWDNGLNEIEKMLDEAEKLAKKLKKI